MTNGEMPIVVRLRDLQQRTEALQDAIQARARSLAEKFPAHHHSTEIEAVVTLDRRGFVIGLKVAGPRDRTLSQEYLAALNHSFACAYAGVELPPRAVRATLAALAAGAEAPSVTVQDDFGHLSVTASFGNIRRIDASRAWLETLSDRSIAAEVLRIAQQAAIASDAFDRFA